MREISWYVDPNELTMRPVHVLDWEFGAEDDNGKAQVTFEWITNKGWTGPTLPACVSRDWVFRTAEEAAQRIKSWVSKLA